MKRKAPYILLAISFLLLLAGIFLDEIALVLQNATTVCLDCIGIG